MNKVIVFGAGEGFANKKEIIESRYKVLALCDNDREKQGREISGLKVISPNKLKEYDFDSIIILFEQIHKILFFVIWYCFSK